MRSVSRGSSRDARLAQRAEERRQRRSGSVMSRDDRSVASSVRDDVWEDKKRRFLEKRRAAKGRGGGDGGGGAAGGGDPRDGDGGRDDGWAPPHRSPPAEREWISEGNSPVPASHRLRSDVDEMRGELRHGSPHDPRDRRRSRTDMSPRDSPFGSRRRDVGGGGGGGGGGGRRSSVDRSSPAAAGRRASRDKPRAPASPRNMSLDISPLSQDRHRRMSPSPSTPEPATPASAKSQYLLDLEEQMRLKQARKNAERLEREEWERRKDGEAGLMDGFGRGGGGAPLRDTEGNVVTNLKEHIRGADPSSPSAAPSPARQSPQLQPLDTRVTRLRSPAPSPSSHRSTMSHKSEYLRDLELQIEEKKRQKERQKREQEDYDRRQEEQANNYFFGVRQNGGGGGGDPHRRADGSIITSLKEAVDSAQTPSQRSSDPATTTREHLFERRGGHGDAPPADDGYRLPSVRLPSPGPSVGPPRGVRWPDEDAGPDARYSGSRPSSVRGDRPSSVRGDAASEIGDSELVELYRDQNSKLKRDLVAVENKLASALDILEAYRARYGPLD